VSKELQSIKFGFCIREDTPINNVATPTKLSSYVANGVMPIYTSAVKDFDNMVRNSKYAFCYDDDLFEEKIDTIMGRDIDWNEIYKEYDDILSSYYSKKYHSENIYQSLKEIIG
jgi:hypothetical protein